MTTTMRAPSRARRLSTLLPLWLVWAAAPAVCSGCSRPPGTSSAGARNKAADAQAAAVALEPTYHGRADMDLTFFSDCHVEVEGEDSVHYRKTYRVDEERHVIVVKGLMELRQGDGGALIDSSERNSTLWQRLEGAGEWSVTGKSRPLQVPRECTCVGAACERP